MEKRNLTAAYKFYCGKDLKNAQQRRGRYLGDNGRVHLSQNEAINLGEEMEDLQGNKLRSPLKIYEKLHDLLNEKMVDLAGRFCLQMTKGKRSLILENKRQNHSQVLKEEPGYYELDDASAIFPLDISES